MIIDLSNMNIPLEVWQKRILLIVGPPCSGKHALIREMLKKEKLLKCIPTITTRMGRSSDISSEIVSVTKGEFEKMEASNEFFYINKKPKASYAYSKSKLEKQISEGNAVALIFHSRGGIGLKQYIANLPTIYLAAPIEVLMERSKKDSSRKTEYYELHKALERNKQAYKMFHETESNCILLQNPADSPPIEERVVTEALEFWWGIIK